MWGKRAFCEYGRHGEFAKFAFWKLDMRFGNIQQHDPALRLSVLIFIMDDPLFLLITMTSLAKTNDTTGLRQCPSLQSMTLPTVTNGFFTAYIEQAIPDPVWIQWVKKTNERLVVQLRLLVVSKTRIYSIKRNRMGKKQVSHFSHVRHYDLTLMFSL